MFELLPFDRREPSLSNYFDALERSFFGNLPTAVNSFKTDILDKGDHFELSAELPGFQKEDISLDLKDDYLTISATHKEEHEEKDEGSNYIRRERRFGSYSRSFDLSGIDVEGIDAKYENGILTLTLPKKSQIQPEPKKILIK